MREKLILNNGYNDYNVNKYYFQTNKNLININEIISLIVISNKIAYGKQGALFE